MSNTIEYVTTEYKPFELHTEEVQQKILDNHRDINVYDEWYEDVIETTRTGLHAIGFYDTEVMFSGFWSQGDGACFTGSYSYTKGALKHIKATYPHWKALVTFAEQLQALQKPLFYTASFDLYKSSNFYSHENTVSISQAVYELSNGEIECISDSKEEEFLCACRAFMQEIYSMLEKEYEYLTSDKLVLEAFEANEYKFNDKCEMLTLYHMCAYNEFNN